MAHVSQRDWLRASKWEDETNDLIHRRVDPEQDHMLQQTSLIERRLTPWSELLAAYWANTKLRQEALDRSTPGHDENVDTDNLDGWNLPSITDTKGFNHRRDFQRSMRLRIGTEFWGFLSLPIEIRRLVYEHLLLLGKIYVPVKYEGIHGSEFREPLDQLLDTRGEPYHRYRDYENFRTTKILTGNFTAGLILGVCKTIHPEAMSVFYGQNQFVFPFGKTVLDDGGHHLDHKLRACWVPMLRDISLSFDSRHMEGTPYVMRQCLFQSGPTVSRSSEEQTLQISHDEADHVLFNAHYAVIDTVTALTKLRRLQLDFEECFCVFGCCRQVVVLCDLLHDLMVDPPESIEVLGFMDDIEKNVIREKLTTLNGITDENRVSFGGLSIVQKMDLYALDKLLA